MKHILRTFSESLSGPGSLFRVASVLASVLGFAAPFEARAFVFKESDMLVGFRQPGGSYEFLSNLGPAINFNTFAAQHPGSSFTITSFTQEKLNSAFSDLGGVSWSVFGSVVTVGLVNPDTYTVWVTRPRLDPVVRSDAWVRQRGSKQSGLAGTIYAVGTGGMLVPGGGSDTEVILDAGVDYGYAARVGFLGDFGGRWQGTVEAATDRKSVV